MQTNSTTFQNALLILYKKDKINQSWPLEAKEIKIGRWPDNDIVIADRWVSRHHACIMRQGLRYIIQDLGSKNGTFINGQRLSSTQELEDGDQIQIAPKYQLAFVDAEATVPIRTASPGLRLDTAQRRAWVSGREILPPLSPAQFSLLELLNGDPARVFGRDEIIAAVWPEAVTAGVSTDAVDSLIRRLRKRLSKLDPAHDYIPAVRGHGFRLIRTK